MANATIPAGSIANHANQLTANVVSVITFTDNIGAVEVISDGAAAVYYTVDGSTPTVGGANCFILPSGSACVGKHDTVNYVSGATTDVISLISAGTPTVSVQRAG